MNVSRFNWSYLASIGLILAGVLSNCSAQPSGPDIQVREAWARPGLEAVPGAFYMTIDNQGGEADTLTGGESSLCSAVEIHKIVKREDDVMGMEPVQGGLDIPGGESVLLEPGGLHLMCVGKSQAFEVGDKLPLTLRFETSKSISLEASVQTGK